MTAAPTRNFVPRPAAAGDLPALARIERECFSDPWSEGALSDTLHNPLAAFLCVDAAPGITVGYVGAYLIGEDADITNIAVLPAYRRRGISAALLAALLDVCREKGVRALHLEVRVSNAPAIALYEKYGFVRDGRRANYYRSPREDALLMTRLLP